MNKIYAPIVLFVYSRPNHTLQTLEALSNNILAEESVLYIYADGAKEDASAEVLDNISETRKILKRKQWCKEVHIIESNINKGLADSIVDGVTEIVNKYGKIIVLEDDIVTSPYFLKYMNDGLDLYQNEDKVMTISAYTHIKATKVISETYFLQYMCCWGWATWKSSWDELILDINYLYHKVFTLPDLDRFTVSNYSDSISQLQQNYNGELKTWAIKWYLSIFLKKGLCLYPHTSLIENIGLDGSGENCLPSGRVVEKKINKPIHIDIIKIDEDKNAYKLLKRHFFIERWKSRIKRRLSFFTKKEI